MLPLSSQALPSQIISAQYGREMTCKLKTKKQKSTLACISNPLGRHHLFKIRDIRLILPWAL